MMSDWGSQTRVFKRNSIENLTEGQDFLCR
jgi:hypothetical protein